MPGLQRADPGQGISRRSCMLMRRILLKVGRGVRRRVSQLGSCLHSPGADQAASSIPCPMRFYYLMIQAINFIIQCSAIVDSSPGADQAESNIPCPMRFYVGTVFTNLIRISVVANVHLRTYASSGFCSRQLLVALFSPHKPAQKSWPEHRQPLRSVHVCTSRQDSQTWSFFRLLRDTRRANARR